MQFFDEVLMPRDCAAACSTESSSPSRMLSFASIIPCILFWESSLGGSQAASLFFWLQKRLKRVVSLGISGSSSSHQAITPGWSLALPWDYFSVARHH